MMGDNPHNDPELRMQAELYEAEISRLSRDLAAARLEITQWQEAFERTCDDIVDVRREKEEMREVLKFYADEKHWTKLGSCVGPAPAPQFTKQDKGEIARAALSAQPAPYKEPERNDLPAKAIWLCPVTGVRCANECNPRGCKLAQRNDPLTPEEGEVLTDALVNGWTHTGITRLGLQALARGPVKSMTETLMNPDEKSSGMPLEAAEDQRSGK